MSKQKRSMTVLMAAVVVAGLVTAPTLASPVYFENPAPGEAGHFVWAPPGDPQEHLDVTLPASSQTGGGVAPGIFALQAWDPQVGELYGEDNGTVHIENVSGLDFVKGLAAGELISSALSDWKGSGAFTWLDPSFGFGTGFIPADQEIYIAVNFDPGDGVHYGWIGVVREAGTPILDAFAWGYNDTPGESIPAGYVPEPGSLALLSLGAMALLRRRS